MGNINLLFWVNARLGFILSENHEKLLIAIQERYLSTWGEEGVGEGDLNVFLALGGKFEQLNLQKLKYPF